MDESTTSREASSWSEWLQRALDERGWRQADLVRESRGTIKRDRVSKWLSGKEQPTYRNAIYAANALQTTERQALYAAGFLSDADLVKPEPEDEHLETSRWLLEIGGLVRLLPNETRAPFMGRVRAELLRLVDPDVGADLDTDDNVSYLGHADVEADLALKPAANTRTRKADREPYAE